MSASPEDENQEEDEETDDWDAAYDHQHPHAVPVFCVRHKQAFVKGDKTPSKTQLPVAEKFVITRHNGLLPLPPSPSALPALTNLQRDHSRRLFGVALPQLTPPLSAVTYVRGDVKGGGG